jgi:hypothetical protein
MRSTTLPRCHRRTLAIAAILVGSLAPAPGAADVWTQVNDSGFGNPDNKSAGAMAEFAGYLYVATLNRETGSEVWKARHGTGAWRDVTPPWGPGVQRPLAMAVFRGRLYVGTDTGHLWQTAGEFTFDPCRGRKPACIRIHPPVTVELWLDVTPDHPAWEPTEVTSLAVFGGRLYATTSAPLQIWRTVDGTRWDLIVPDALGDAENNHSGKLGVFGGALYVGTSRERAGAPGEKGDGLEIWRSADGLGWEAVVATGEPGAGMSSGFGLPGNGTTTALAVFEGRLHVATVNHTDGAQVWGFDGLGWEEVTPPAHDATRQTVRLQTMAVFERRLFVGEGIRPDSALVWATRDTETWAPANGDGFGDLSNAIDGMLATRSALFAAVMNNGTGVEIWAKRRLPVDLVPEPVDTVCLRRPWVCERLFPRP